MYAVSRSAKHLKGILEIIETWRGSIYGGILLLHSSKRALTLLYSSCTSNADSSDIIQSA
jgi:hypothetical protein